MKTNHPRPAYWLLFNAALLVLATSCASQKERSFNDDFNQHLPTAPKYVIEDGGSSWFTVTVYQGIPMQGAQRAIHVKQAASAVAEAECKRRGWENSNLDYIMERDQGWMHIVKAEVTRQAPVQLQSMQPTNSP